MGLGGMRGARSRVRLCHNSSAAPATLQPRPQGPTQPPHHPPSQHYHHGHGRASSSREDTLARGRNRQHRFALVPDDTRGPRSLRLVWAKPAGRGGSCSCPPPDRSCHHSHHQAQSSAGTMAQAGQEGNNPGTAGAAGDAGCTPKGMGSPCVLRGHGPARAALVQF